MNSSPSKATILSEISRDIAQVFFASMFVGPIISDAVSWPIVFSGLALSFSCWLLSLSVVVKEKSYE
ncbi:MAG: hypothetical protein UX02_C0001G0287 [Candidatus Moranbacteria bacterium GW2011_GWC1_45_18]|nr:MAG: hypothetical protein UT79_C0002G0110 [Candidatus Moranbacteria bacterium GW2011_GWC2_40_12]KKT32489.1 MAG: hypothetical protein UW19_C0020G0006 [Candidatus Moranbacteria bacterium GW2011_GWF2_44_10]KKU00839.1 MAG: hypothetical protein UX02_C0001G0287 [Candidatus Moranbacteria bacterium GW2011_GWC1_45_18]